MYRLTNLIGVRGRWKMTSRLHRKKPKKTKKSAKKAYPSNSQTFVPKATPLPSVPSPNKHGEEGAEKKKKFRKVQDAVPLCLVLQLSEVVLKCVIVLLFASKK